MLHSIIKSSNVVLLRNTSLIFPPETIRHSKHINNYRVKEPCRIEVGDFLSLTVSFLSFSGLKRRVGPLQSRLVSG